MSLRLRVLLLLGPALVAFGCGDNGPTGPDNSDLEILIVRGDLQYAAPGDVLPVPLEVRVQGRSDGKGKEEVEVRWEILEGAGAQVDQETTLTDEEGRASVHLTLGSEIGRYRVQASVKGLPSGPAVFEAQAILAPELTGVPGSPVRAGDTISLEGRNLSTDPDANIVTFSRIRGRVVSASSTELRVEVPPCLPPRSVVLRLQIGALGTPGTSLEITEANRFLSLLPGEDRVLDASEGLACFRLPSESGSQYLLVAHSIGTVGGANYEVELTGLDRENPPQGLILEPRAGGLPRSVPLQELGATPSGPSLQDLWDARLRMLEAELLEEAGTMDRSGTMGPVLAEAPAGAPPQVGDRRQFNVLTPENEFEKVWARAEYVSDHAVLFFDEATPAGGFTAEDMAEMASQFETPIYPTVTGEFGSESDLDENDRVIILFTPAVNRLTPEASDSYIGGYFFGVDLLTDRTGSNKGEVFYAVVPDPTGIHGPVLDRPTLRLSLPAILAHEFEHMVHFYQRILVSGADVQDALWLSEALAQMAEDLVGSAYRSLGDEEQAKAFQAGNWNRARRFLLEPNRVSLLATLPPGTLAERGAGWLFLKYLHGHDDQGTLLKSLVASTRTGIQNVTATTGVSWGDLISDWAGALYLDGLPVAVRPELKVPNVNLREVLSTLDGQFPLKPTQTGSQSFQRLTSLWSSAPDYYIITPPEVGGVALNVSGPEGRPPEPAAGLRVLIVRLF